ncbi:hypothetical protein AB0C59_19165 [Streptomyces sp. NPDC048664]|uniref:hypothetical protein n=1 Tax=Streptomyces sp. NPDC048664 TaxID=3154505 RepID=UPI003429663B
MTTRTLTAAAVLVAASAMLLTACGGGNTSPDAIKGAETGNPTSGTPSGPATTGAPRGAGAPDFALPSDVKVQLEGFTNSDPDKGPVLRDTSYAITAILEAEVKGSGNTPNFTRFWTGLKGAEYADTLNKWAKSGMSVTGTYHYYEPAVRVANGTATVTYCEDQRKGYAKVRKTGQVKVTTPSAKDFTQWSLGLAKAENGEWHVVDYKTLQGAKACQVG